MTISFGCACGAAFRVEDRLAGKRAKCPRCGASLTIPVAPSAPEGTGSPDSPWSAAEVVPALPPAGPPAAGPADRICPICQWPIEAGGAATACPDCRTVYHEECWREVGGCAVYGCARVPPTEQLTELEIPASYWGREHKNCPSCGVEIMAAAIRCRYCGAVFASVAPLDRDQYLRNADTEGRVPALQRMAKWLFVLNAFTCTAPFAGIGGLVWYLAHRQDLPHMSSLTQALAKIGIALGLGQTLLMTLVLAGFLILH